MLTKKL
jgi:hypothetical protein